MRKWMLACAVVTLVGFTAAPAPAQETIPAPTIVTAQPATTTQRTGILPRLFGNRSTTTVRGVSATTTMPPATTTGVIPATGTTTTMAAQTQTTETRQGLLGRMRARLGR
jgi:hypothetical protein